MKILLIQPAMGVRPMDTLLKTRMSPPLALYSLVTLTPDKHDVVVEDENIGPIHYDAPVDLVGITATVDVIDRAVRIAGEFRRRGVNVVAGGVHVSALPHLYADSFDALCVGMAERVWSVILKDAEQGTLRKIYSDMDGIRGSEIVSPAYERIPKGPYLYTNVLFASKGCPFHCKFCYNSCPSVVPHFLVRDREAVADDLRRLQSRHVMFIDDNFIGNPNWTRAFLPVLKDMGLRWNAAVSANVMEHEGMLEAMSDAGCMSLFIGFESISQDALIAAEKKQNQVQNYERLLHRMEDLGIMANASIVFGLDHDDASVFDATAEWAIKNRVASVTAHILTPYPGTVLYDEMSSAGRLTDHDLSHYNTAHVVFEPKNMSPEELRQGYLGFYRNLYSLKNIFRRMPKARIQNLPFLLFNLLYRKFGGFSAGLSRIVPLATIGKVSSRLAYFSFTRRKKKSAAAMRG